MTEDYIEKAKREAELELMYDLMIELAEMRREMMKSDG